MFRVPTNGRVALALIAIGFIAAPLSCSSRSSTEGAGLSLAMGDVVLNYGAIVEASYDDTVTTAEALESAIEAFLANPTSSTFAAAKQAWLAAREPYGQTEAFRFYRGPIDDPKDGLEGLINGWPLDESYIDYVVDPISGDTVQSGVINDPQQPITKEALQSLNEKQAESSISTGYHAIEFLLWGQDRNQTPSERGGKRPLSDYVRDGDDSDDDPVARRRLYLQLASELLVEHLRTVQAQWKSTPGSYRAGFEGDDVKLSLARIIIGVGSLAASELSGERMKVSLETRDQEDEHSCFSDNTHRDVFNNAKGIINVYRGSYTRFDGTVVGNGKGLAYLVALANPTRKAAMDQEIATIETGIQAISDRAENGEPYDQQIKDDTARADIQAVIEALERFADLLARSAADDLGLTLNFIGPDGEPI